MREVVYPLIEGLLTFLGKLLMKMGTLKYSYRFSHRKNSGEESIDRQVELTVSRENK